MTDLTTWQVDFNALLAQLPDRGLADDLKAHAARKIREALTISDGAPSTWADAAEVLGEMFWAWPGWLPCGLLSMLVGAPGLGKSILALRIAACFLRGDPWPDGTPYDGKPGEVLWIETEAAQGLNVPRAKAWGLPCEHILTPLSDPLEDVCLDNPEHQVAITSKANLPAVKFVIVDSFSGGNSRDENLSGSLQSVKWLGELSRDTGKPLLLCHHLRKKSTFDGDGLSLDRVRGHGSLVQVARLVWGLDQPDPQDEARALFVLKDNLGRKPNPLGMVISDNGVTFDASPPEPPRQETLQDKAGDLLLSLLAHDAKEAAELQAEIEAAGLSWHAAKRAKETLGIVSIRRDGRWLWSLPARGE